MQNWLIFQRISLFLYLTAGVLLLIYALGFISNVYIFYAYGSKGLVDFYHEMQVINDDLLLKAIFAIVFSLLLFLLRLGSSPAGIITLIISVIITGLSVWFSAGSFIALMEARETYLNLDLSSLNRYIQRGTINYNHSSLAFDMGLGGYLLFLLSSVFMLITVMRNAFTVRITKAEGRENK